MGLWEALRGSSPLQMGCPLLPAGWKKLVPGAWEAVTADRGISCLEFSFICSVNKTVLDQSRSQTEREAESSTQTSFSETALPQQSIPMRKC